MKAKLTKLYTEHKCGKEYIGDYPADEVIVRLHKWSGGGYNDIVLGTEVTVDGKVESESRELLQPNIGNSKAIRKAIAIFDTLVMAHPTLSEKEKVE